MPESICPPNGTRVRINEPTYKNSHGKTGTVIRGDNCPTTQPKNRFGKAIDGNWGEMALVKMDHSGNSLFWWSWEFVILKENT